MRAETTPSTQWGSALVSRLSSGLVRDRNRFVCMQLATMASEQLEKVQRARNEGDGAALRHARSVFLSTLEVGGELVGAALHYPRAASKRSPKSNVSGSGGDCGSGSSMGDLFPHVYVELICINRPGKGYGSLLLQHGELARDGMHGFGPCHRFLAAQVQLPWRVAAVGRRYWGSRESKVLRKLLGMPHGWCVPGAFSLARVPILFCDGILLVNSPQHSTHSHLPPFALMTLRPRLSPRPPSMHSQSRRSPSPMLCPSCAPPCKTAPPAPPPQQPPPPPLQLAPPQATYLLLLLLLVVQPPPPSAPQSAPRASGASSCCLWSLPSASTLLTDTLSPTRRRR